MNTASAIDTKIVTVTSLALNDDIEKLQTLSYVQSAAFPTARSTRQSSGIGRHEKKGSD
jgi:hypothetical protein